MVDEMSRRAGKTVWTLGLGLALVACVQARDKNELGTSTVSSGVSFANPDYVAAPGAPASSAMPVTPVQPSGTPGASGAAAPLPSAPMTGGTQGAAGSLSTATAGSSAPTQGGSGTAGRGIGGSTAPAGGADAPATVSAGTLQVTFTSVNLGGRYAPLNVGAVWIETASGMFVKTLERWAGIRAFHLETWAAASGGWGGGFVFFGGGGGGNAEDQMDAISRATLRRHEMHQLTWDLMGLDGQLVPDGKYKVRIEVADDNFVASTNGGAEFEKGPMPQTVMAPDQAPYAGLKVTYQP